MHRDESGLPMFMHKPYTKDQTASEGSSLDRKRVEHRNQANDTFVLRQSVRTKSSLCTYWIVLRLRQNQFVAIEVNKGKFKKSYGQQVSINRSLWCSRSNRKVSELNPCSLSRKLKPTEVKSGKFGSFIKLLNIFYSSWCKTSFWMSVAKTNTSWTVFNEWRRESRLWRTGWKKYPRSGNNEQKVQNHKICLK